MTDHSGKAADQRMLWATAMGLGRVAYASYMSQVGSAHDRGVDMGLAAMKTFLSDYGISDAVFVHDYMERARANLYTMGQ